MQKHRAITLERLELLESGKCFMDSDNINILSQLYQERRVVEGITVWRNSGRISFREMFEHAEEFQPCQIGEEFGPTWSTHWFQVQCDVPKEWESKEIHFLWDSSSEASLWSESGTILQGFNGSQGQDRRAEYILHQPGSRFQKTITFYIEMACNEMFGAGNNGMIQPPNNEKHFALKVCHVAIYEREIWNLYCDFKVLFDMARTLPPDQQRSQDALFTANQICNLFDPFSSLSWARCRVLASEFLKHTNGSSTHTMYACGHCHIDTAWLWPYAETRRKCARSWATALEYMKHHPTYRFCASSAQQYDWIKNDYPELFTRIQNSAKANFFEIVGGTWVEFDGNIPSGESIVRQFLYGQQFFKTNFGLECKEFFMPDTFGYCAQLPQIMKKAGIEFFVTQKLSWNLVNKFPHNSFYWKGIDGTSVLTHFPPADTYNASVSVEDLHKSIVNNKDLSRAPVSLLLYGHGDGGGGPTFQMMEMLQRMEDLEGLPKTKIASVHSFFEVLASSSRDLCTWHGELYLELHRGTYTTQAWIKQMNRKCELILRDCEILSIFNRINGSGLAYPFALLDEHWKLLLLNQFHDVLPGTSIGMVYEDSMRHYRQIMEVCNNLIAERLDALQDVDTRGDIFILNTLSWERYELVEIDDPLPASLRGGVYQKSGIKTNASLLLVCVPSMGISCSAMVEFDSTLNCRVSCEEGYYQLENSFVRARFDGLGRLTSFLYKCTGREAIDQTQPGNQFTLYEDVPFFWDAWDIMVYHLETRQPILPDDATISIVENGPLRCTLLLEFTFSAGSSVSQYISLTALSSQIDFRSVVDWKESRKLLKVEFPSTILSPSASYEIQYGYVTRPTHFNTSWDLAKFEVCGHRWADLSEFGFGMAILNDCKYSYAIHGKKMSLTLLKAPKAPDESCDIGRHTFTYSLLPHGGDGFQSGGVIQKALELNVPLLTKLGGYPISSPSSFITLSKKNCILDAMKEAEDRSGDIILRFYEAYGGSCSLSVSFSFTVSSIQFCNLLEQVEAKQAQILSENVTSFTIQFNPFEIITLRVALSKG